MGHLFAASIDMVTAWPTPLTGKSETTGIVADSCSICRTTSNAMIATVVPQLRCNFGPLYPHSQHGLGAMKVHPAPVGLELWRRAQCGGPLTIGVAASLPPLQHEAVRWSLRG
jgi:hypothetical protein